ncbi:MAG: hypothetical protein ACLR1T_12570 [Evtepia gabavorous]
MAAILYRYAAYKGYDVSQKADLSATPTPPPSAATPRTLWPGPMPRSLSPG